MIRKPFVNCRNTTKPFQSLFNISQSSVAPAAHHLSHHHEHPAQ